MVLCAVITSSLYATAQAKNSNNSSHKANSNSDKAAPHQTKWHKDPVVFNTRDRNAIRSYYRGSNSNLPPGLAKRNGNLPPGLQKQLQRNGVLPPGLQKQMQPLSSDVEHRLQTLNSRYTRGIIGQDIVIVDNRTQRIMDIIRDVVVRR
jgi:hypothetical protein